MPLLGPALLFAHFVAVQGPTDNFPHVPENNAPYEAIEDFIRDGLIRSVPFLRGSWPLSRTQFARYTIEAVKNLPRASQEYLDSPESAVLKTARGPARALLVYFESQEPRFRLLFKNFAPQFRAQGYDIAKLRGMIANCKVKVCTASDVRESLQELRGGALVPDSGVTSRDYEAWRHLAVQWTFIPEFDCVDRYGGKGSPTFTRDEFARMTIAVAGASLSKLNVENEWLKDQLERQGSVDKDARKKDLAFYESDWPGELRNLVKDFAGEIAAQHTDPVPLFKKAEEGERLSRENALLCRKLLGLPSSMAKVDP